MKYSFEKITLDLFLKILVFLLLFFITLISHTKNVSSFQKDFLLLIIFQLSIYFSKHTPLATIMIIGFLYDVLNFSFLGFYTFWFTTMHILLKSKIDYLFFKDFYYSWVIFCSLIIIRFALYSLLDWHISFYDSLCICFTYPLTAKIFQNLTNTVSR